MLISEDALRQFHPHPLIGNGARPTSASPSVVGSPTPAPKPEPELRTAQTAQIDEAISAEYDCADAVGKKPPNLNELVAPVQKRLRAQGFIVKKATIQGRAKDRQHAERRIGRGVRVNRRFSPLPSKKI